MTDSKPTVSVRDLLLTRQGLAFVAGAGFRASENHLRAVEVDLADIGYVLSTRLHSRLARCSLDQLTAFRAQAMAALRAQVGGGQKHEPLFRKFPEGVPDDTLELWWKKVLAHFLQVEHQPCLFCRKRGATYVLNPCVHVVCSNCFDGSNYGGCPVCEEPVDRSSPFFKQMPVRGQPAEHVIFKLIDLGEDLDEAAKALFVSLCERKQAMSPIDRDAMAVLVEGYGSRVLEWMPGKVPVRENVAAVFGSLSLDLPPREWLPQARRHWTTATDVLRFIAVRSGTDGSLQTETKFKLLEQKVALTHWTRLARLLGRTVGVETRQVRVPFKVKRFKVARMTRSLRRELLAVLDGLHPDLLVEDMLRHQSYWIWVGEFLHPHEYAERFPHVARAFQVIRKQGPKGEPAPDFKTWYSRLEKAFESKDTEALLDILGERPGEFGRRLDRLLRNAPDGSGRDKVIAMFLEEMGGMSTPLLLTLRSHLPSRSMPAGVRVYWPKAKVATGVSAPDRREVIPGETLQRLERGLTGELLRRIAAKPGFAAAVVDEELRRVVAPFNERTASRSAVSLPRGSRIPVPEGKVARLFLHWCEPERGGHTTDIDLSVAFYDAGWKYLGVCSYYELKHKDIAKSSGDMRGAPWPDGAAEFVDVHRDQALKAGIRYAVMVVNAYAGMPFSLLERGFAGIMLRDDAGGMHFDPRTVRLKFALQGENGAYMPLVLDFAENVLHWLDVQSKGSLIMNNVETSRKSIAKVCPELIRYFGSGVRTTMYDLGLLHAAARSQNVYRRGPSGISLFSRAAGEDAAAFHARLLRGEGGEDVDADKIDPSSMLAILYQGDFEIPAGSLVYALFRDQVTPNLAAADLIS